MILSSLAFEDTAGFLTIDCHDHQLGEPKHPTDVNLHESRNNIKEYSDSDS